MRNLLILFFLVISIVDLCAQGNLQYTRHDINSDARFRFSDIARLPETHKYYVTPSGNNPAYLINGDTYAIESTQDVGTYPLGARTTLSRTGKYVMIQSLTYLEYKLKNRETYLVVVDPLSGKILLNLSKVNDACFHPNEEEVWYLSDGMVRSVSLATRKDIEVFKFPGATNCLALSPDGKYLALSHKPTKEFLDSYVTRKGQKNNYKIYEKFRQCISVFNTSDLSLAHLASEMVDIPYVLEYSPKGDFLLCYSQPHDKLTSTTTAGNTDYISKIDAATGIVLNEGFVSNSLYEPDLEFSNSHDYLAIVTINRTKLPEVWVCDFGSAGIVARFECGKNTLGEAMKNELKADASRVGVAFTADDRNMLITYGSILLNWTIPYE